MSNLDGVPNIIKASEGASSFDSGKAKAPSGPPKVFPFETMPRPLKPPGRP